MKKKLFNACVLWGMAILFFCVASVQISQMTYDARATLGNIVRLNGDDVTEIFGTKVSEIFTSETKKFEEKIREAEVEEEKRLSIEKAKIEEEERLADALTEWRTHYGSYRIAEYLPTYSYLGSEMLPEKEAILMTRQIIKLSEDIFVTYDNYRESESEILDFFSENYRLDKIEIEHPDYRIVNVQAEENFGIQNDKLPKELVRSKYVEIDVYPGYDRNGDKYIPHLYLSNDGRIIMSAMGDYFLLERVDDQEKAANNQMGNIETNDELSVWIGKYSYYEQGTTGGGGPMMMNYKIEIYENELGEYYADIHMVGHTMRVSMRAEIDVDNERISLYPKKYLPGSVMDKWIWKGVFLSFEKDGDDIYTYWPQNETMIFIDMEPGIYFEKIA